MGLGWALAASPSASATGAVRQSSSIGANCATWDSWRANTCPAGGRPHGIRSCRRSACRTRTADGPTLTPSPAAREPWTPISSLAQLAHRSTPLNPLQPTPNRRSVVRQLRRMARQNRRTPLRRLTRHRPKSTTTNWRTPVRLDWRTGVRHGVGRGVGSLQPQLLCVLHTLPPLSPLPQKRESREEHVRTRTGKHERGESREPRPSAPSWVKCSPRAAAWRRRSWTP